MKRMISSRSLLRSLSALFVALSLGVACTPSENKNKDEAKSGEEVAAHADDAKAPAATGPVATVNGVDVSREPFARQMERTEARFKRASREISPALETRLKENIIRKLVDEELVRQKAKAEGIEIAAAEIEERFVDHKKRFGDDAQFKAFLERTNQSEVDVRDDLEKNLIREKLFDKLLAGDEPTDAEVKEYYEANKQKYAQREQVKASHILIKVNKGATDQEKQAAFDKAKKVYGDAKKPGADFAKLAQEHSEGPTAKRGGDLGAFSRGRMVKPFEDAAFAAKPGQVVGPVETQFGYHVIKVFEKTPAQERKFDEVKDTIVNQLKARKKSKATRELLTDLRKEAKIEVLEAGVDLKREPSGSADDRPGIPGMNPKVDLKKLREQMHSVKKAPAPAHHDAPGGGE